MRTVNLNNVEIKQFTAAIRSELEEHLQRHVKESGRNGIHFMPFTSDDPDGPGEISMEKALLPIDRPGWQRWFCAQDTVSGVIIGHVDLKHDGLRVGSHRCELGIGIEESYRSNGLGKQLMNAAIDYACGKEFLTWIDLRVFGNNTWARALYQQLGFVEVGVLRDRFRIGGESIDDVLMVLDVSSDAVLNAGSERRRK
jgi:RimJ/RimL family protein N-acetyltransferase